MLFWHFWWNCIRIVCSLYNPDESELLRGKKVLGNWFFRRTNIFKILTFNCNRCLLDWLDVKYIYSFLFDNCHCDEKHEVFATRCAPSLYNLIGFGRNYFASIVCSCCHIAKNLVCGHCSSHRMNLNFNTMKIWVAKKDLPKEIKLMEINKLFRNVLESRSTVFFIVKKQIKLKFLLTALIGVSSFTIKKPCK